MVNLETGGVLWDIKLSILTGGVSTEDWSKANSSAYPYMTPLLISKRKYIFRGVFGEKYNIKKILLYMFVIRLIVNFLDLKINQLKKNKTPLNPKVKRILRYVDHLTDHGQKPYV